MADHTMTASGAQRSTLLPDRHAAARATGAASMVPGVDLMIFGGDYNPEQWPRETWHEDVALMREAGVNLVSVAVFAWALLEPREGEFEFGWLDELMDLLADNGIGASLGTPTAAPPAWFWKKYPAARPVSRDGVTLGFGSRGMASPSSPEYASASARITAELARRYAKHPALKLWHVHNEYGAPISECYSDYSVAAFRTWLQRRYDTLDTLNQSWGTSFWGQRYGEWDEVDAPRLAASVVNPAQRLDFKRFSSDALLQCFIRERDILHELSPSIPVTTNFMATSCPAVDYWRWAREVDVISNNHYLTGERGDSHVMLSMDADLTRSLAGGRPWLLTEHSTSAVNWQPRNIAKRPGELARNSLAHLARGADGLMFFQWRASVFGAEKFHSAMLPAAGTDSRIWREVVDLGGAIARLDEMRGSRVAAKVAMIWDWESFWAHDLEWRPSVDLKHREQIEEYYSWFWHAGITVDFAHPESDLSGYETVIAPSLYLVSALASANLTSYVSAGGRLIVGCFSGIVDAADTVYPGAMPGALRDVLGVTVEEFLPLRSGEIVELTGGLTARSWTEALIPNGATGVHDYLTGPGASAPAVTRNEFGSGTAWYISTRLTGAALDTVLAPILGESSRSGLHDLETVERVGAGTRFDVHINHGTTRVVVAGGGVDLLTGDHFMSDVVVDPGAVRIIARQFTEQ